MEDTLELVRLEDSPDNNKQKAVVVVDAAAAAVDDAAVENTQQLQQQQPLGLESKLRIVVRPWRRQRQHLQFHNEPSWRQKHRGRAFVDVDVAAVVAVVADVGLDVPLPVPVAEDVLPILHCH
jgi:hypothetical protein